MRLPTLFLTVTLAITLTAAEEIVLTPADETTRAPADQIKLTPAGQDLQQVLDRAKADYTVRLRQAGTELVAARTRIAGERAPLLKRLNDAEERLLTAESVRLQLQTADREGTDERNRLAKAAAALHQNVNYLNTVTQEGLKAFGDGLLPGEDQAIGPRVRDLQQAFEPGAQAPGPDASLDAAEFLLAEVRLALGGRAVRGQSLLDGSNEVKSGVLLFLGPQTFFRADSGETGVAVRLRDGAAHPVTFPVSGWNASAAAPVFAGARGMIAADATGNKALRLRETRGTLREHVAKGGYVAFAILGVGLFAAVLAIQKLVDAARLRVDDPAKVQAVLDRLRADGRPAAEAALGQLAGASRELVATGLRYMGEGKTALEERLQAWLLKQRLHSERRLPLLAVIATAAPLMGLLGTVVGMVKTFALITVFGTGNAGKLASGISEVLVATELGLAVAIPTLVIHGFLSQRIHRKLAALERQALEFVTAASATREEEPVAR
jgi:biopolymer transport protein ExbB